MKFPVLTLATAIPALAAAVPASVGTAEVKRDNCKLTLQWISNWSEAALRRYRVQLITTPRNDAHLGKYCDLFKAGSSGYQNVQCFWTNGMYVIDDSQGEGSPGHDLYLKDFNLAAHYFELITGCDTIDGWLLILKVYNKASRSGSTTGVVYHDVVVLVQTIEQGVDKNTSTLNYITMSTKDIKNPTNWSTSTKIDSFSSGCISMYIRKEDLDNSPDGSIRFMYFDLESLGPRELTLDMVAMAWYPSPIPMPEGTGSFNTGFDSAGSGIGTAASPDGMLVWANLQPDNDANKVAMFRYSVARGSEDWSQQFIFQVDPSYTFEVPLSMTYLYGDLIVAWPSLEAIRFSMQRPGGCFDLTCWMKAIDDSLLVSELSIPDQERNSQTSILGRISLGTSYPDPTKKQIVSFTTDSGIPFTVQDHAISTGSATEVETDINGKSALVVTMIEKTAETGSVSPNGDSTTYPPLMANTWHFN
ncbi:hypothetical protein FNAPI_2604 [Fusarium napiforme]|uniref:Uncharacterized protein n=1 Tax=Fusarium napiforme TaxID=42672 RepID=A0A8H5JXL3_9HYPO|nr:hypothetical protein FNAPI_2604 [Fusarium napiforme]